jgi:hypothetical protein
MMVRWFAGDIGVTTIRQIDMLHDALFGEQVKEAEDRCAPNPQSAFRCVRNKVGSGEVPAPLADQGSQLAPRPSEADPCAVE